MRRPHRIAPAVLILIGLVGCKREIPASKPAVLAAPVVYMINNHTPHVIGAFVSRGQHQYLYAKKGAAGFLLHGPYVSLHEGSFKVTFRLRADRPGARDVATLDVNAFDPPTRTGRMLSSLIILGDDFAAPDQFRDFLVYFSTKGLARGTLYEFRVRSSGQSGLWVEQTTLQQVE